MIETIRQQLGDNAHLLDYQCTGVPKDGLYLPGPDFIDRVVSQTDRSPQVLCSLERMYRTGRLANTGFISILPVDQGIEHSAGVVRAQPDLLRSREHRRARHRGRLQRRGLDPGRAGRRVAQVRPQDPLHGQAQPQRDADLPEHLRPDPVRQRRPGLRHGRGRRSARPSTSAPRAAARSRSFRGLPRAHELGMVTVLWCYLRNSGLQEGRHRLPRRRRPDRPGQPPGRHHRGRHHQAEAAD
jgi:class I fructose-bisphosphate aldolase